MGETYNAIVRQADAQAARERAGVEYLAAAIEERQPILDLLYTDDGNPLEPTELFEQVKHDIDTLTTIYVRPSGINVYNVAPKDLMIKSVQTPVVQLSWAEYNFAFSNCNHPEDKPTPYILELTSEGIDFINGYRSAQGLVSLQEQQRLNRERNDTVIKAVTDNQAR